MIATFILGALAAWGTPQMETQVKEWLERLLPLNDLSAPEMRGITLAVLLLAAAILAGLLGSHSGIALAAGAVVGVLGPRAYRRFKLATSPDYDS